MFITRLSLAYLLVAMASAYPASQGHGHGHDHSLANGQTCSQSVSEEARTKRKWVLRALMRHLLPRTDPMSVRLLPPWSL